MGVSKKLIYVLAEPVDEPLGIKKFRWSLWYTMHAVHQARRRAVFDTINPLENDRFL